MEEKFINFLKKTEIYTVLKIDEDRRKIQFELDNFDINSFEEIYKIAKSTLDLSEDTKEVISTSLKLLMSGIRTGIINDIGEELEENIEKYFGKNSKILSKFK